ncbi:MAG TPA: transglutaminase-like domain-containing protein [Polyangia bacterium]|jgi:hypothetical protein|nr:transglutaminase-like domain-containing protein [Polyangia bacterium]
MRATLTRAYVQTTLVVLSLTSGTAQAQLLHERVSVGKLRCANGVCWRQGRPDDGAAALLSDGELVPAPIGSAQPEANEPVYTTSGESAPTETTQGAAPPTTSPSADAAQPATHVDRPPERQPRLAIDRDTGPEPPGTRTYHEVFNPATFPFKRMSALDAVAPDESLVLSERSSEREAMSVVGAEQRSADRDAFWGSIVIDFEPGEWIPLPSVAADARILAYRTEPPIAVNFAKDGADNHFVSSSAGGRHRLIWLSDAPQRYFAGVLPAEARLGDEPRLLVPPLPAATKKRAQAVLARLGVDTRPDASLGGALATLVSWFRAFQSGPPPAPSTSPYADLALAQHGSCRHRSYAFVVTALAAGIPARYVENELHVFVEVYLPRVGWRRINLGGALVDNQVAGSDGKVPYRAKGEDTLPQPQTFANGGDALPPTPPELIAAAARAQSSARGKGHASSLSGAAHVRINLDALDALDRAPPPRSTAAAATTNASHDSGDEPHAGRATPPADTKITVALDKRDAFRGDRIDVSGAVTSSDGHPGALPVEIYLAAPDGALRVGDAVTGADGRWHATLEVPRDLPLGDHRVVARTPGDAQHRSSRTR